MAIYGNTQYSKEVLLAIDEMPIKEIFVKLELLNWQEKSIKEIQGKLTGGTINLNGESTVRRTCNFSFITDDVSIENDILLKSKFRLWIGVKNRLPQSLNVLDDILWFNEGLYIFTGISFNHNSNNLTANITAKDKGCLLNGDVAGVIPETAVLHEYELEAEDGNISYEPILIYNIIYELMSHYGGENKARIFVNDIPEKIRQLMEYRGATPIWMETNGDTSITGVGTFTGNYQYAEDLYGNLIAEDPYDGNGKLVTAGDPIGYVLTDFIYPGELIAAPGDTVASVLDKIKSVLGNFEYFYDVEGNFVFQEIRNYLNNSFQPITSSVDDVTLLAPRDYQNNFDMEEIIYSFVDDGRKMISSVSNNPNYNNIKNDFVVWGMRTTASGAELPIRFHLAIDKKPEAGSDGEWREALYQYCNVNNATDMNEEGWQYYENEMNAEWRKLYDGENWSDTVKQNPQNLDFFIDFIDEELADYSKYSVNKIGRRTYAEMNDDCKLLFNKSIPDVIFCETIEEYNAAVATGEYNYVVLGDAHLMGTMQISANSLSCYERIRELLYEHLTLNESITIQVIPIYWLEPNRKIEVKDIGAQVNGQYMIKSISIPLAYNGLMNIQATRALSRL